MSQLDDTRLERTLRELLGAGDPGPASPQLRERVDGIPDTAPTRVRPRILSALGGLAGLAAAAAILLAVLGRPTGVRVPPAGGVLRPGAAQNATFDPRLIGPGMVGAGVPTEWVVALLMLAGVAVVAFGVRLGARRGFVPIVVVAIAGLGAVQTLTVDVGPGPVTSSRALGMTFVSPAAGSSAKDVGYITAAPGEPFTILVSISNDGSMPIRLLGLHDPATADLVMVPRITAVWRDTAPNGGTQDMDMAVPLTPIDIAPHEFVVLYLVGRAGQCAFGPTYDPSLASTVGYGGLGDLQVVYSVYGMPRTMLLRWPYEILEPQPSPCPPQP